MRPSMPSRFTALAEKTADWFRRANAGLLSQVPCRAGCSHCCKGVFPITRLDVRLLEEGLARLRSDQRAVIEGRAVQQVNAIEAAYPRLRISSAIDRWSDDEVDQAVHTFQDAPCPALQTDGLCALYTYRPLPCRSMGIPAREDDMVHGACPVQTFVPVVRLSASLETEELELAAAEAALLEGLPEVAADGEEVFLPYAFVPRTGTDSVSEHTQALPGQHQ